MDAGTVLSGRVILAAPLRRTTRISHRGRRDLRQNHPSPAVSELLQARSLREPPSRGARALPPDILATLAACRLRSQPTSTLEVCARQYVSTYACGATLTRTAMHRCISTLAPTLLRPPRLDDA